MLNCDDFASGFVKTTPVLTKPKWFVTLSYVALFRAGARSSHDSNQGQWGGEAARGGAQGFGTLQAQKFVVWQQELAFKFAF
jgi:hypothetical protein